MLAEQIIRRAPQEAQVNWKLAACRTGDGGLAALFFSEQLDDIASAKSICAGCDLIVPCLEGAIERREPWGVWGGQLFANGKILAHKRKRGRPPKVRPLEVDLDSDLGRGVASLGGLGVVAAQSA
ncbi:MAG TPA: WhiB family transcriptional regulator [Acidimicrobiales bacterium]|jgi:WhiB family redox-sensing transcriptional regulator|nr:WhiB family transcriptional regulator [Acidimicrobiales bacterium]